MVEQKNQIYEKYWSITLEYTDINGERFIGTLKIIVDHIDKNKGRYSKEIYQELQEKIYEKYPKRDYASVRKSINQFVKLGLIKIKRCSCFEHELMNDTYDLVYKRLASIQEEIKLIEEAI